MAKKTVTQNPAANAQTTKPGMEHGTQNQPTRVNSFVFIVHNFAYIFSDERPPSPAADERSEKAVGCKALLGFATMFHSYYYFPSCVSFFQIPDSPRDITQWVAPVDDRSDFSGFEELSHD